MRSVRCDSDVNSGGNNDSQRSQYFSSPRVNQSPSNAPKLIETTATGPVPAAQPVGTSCYFELGNNNHGGTKSTYLPTTPGYMPTSANIPCATLPNETAYVPSSTMTAVGSMPEASSTMTAFGECPVTFAGGSSTITAVGALPMEPVDCSTMTAIGNLPSSTMTAIGSLPSSTMTAIGNLPSSTMTAVGGVPTYGGSSTMTAIGAMPVGNFQGSSTMTAVEVVSGTTSMTAISEIPDITTGCSSAESLTAVNSVGEVPSDVSCGTESVYFSVSPCGNTPNRAQPKLASPATAPAPTQQATTSPAPSQFMRYSATNNTGGNGNNSVYFSPK